MAAGEGDLRRGERLLDNAARIERLVKTVFQGFRDLVSGASVGQIAERVETTLGGLVAPIFDAAIL